MIEKLRLTRFCKCCTVRTGSLVIGVFGWIGSLVNAIALSTPPQTEDILSQTTSDEGTTIYIEEETGPNISTILLSIFMFCISVSLVIGVYKDHRPFILPWLVIKFLECIAISIAAVVFFFLLFVTYNPGILFLAFIIIGGISALFWYCWLCVWSLYMDLGEVTTTIVPVGNSYPMTEPMNMQVEQYPPPYPTQETAMTKTMSPQQEMV